MKTLTFLVCFLFCLSLGSEPISSASSDGSSFLEDSLCDSEDDFSAPQESCWTLQAEAGYAAGKFLGFERNYGELGLFIVPPSYGEWQPYGDVRGYRLNQGKWAGSIGLGVRWWNDYLNRLIGANIYFDSQEAHVSSFQRIGLGLEALGDCFDVRINGYLSVNGSVNKGHRHTFYFLSGFVETCQVKESAFDGFDAEIGRRLWCYDCISLYGAVGPYYYRSKYESIVGGYVRFEASWREWARIELNLSQDNHYHTQCQVKGVVSFPFSIFCCEPYCQAECQRCPVQPVRRNPLIPTHRCCDYHQNWSVESCD